MKNSDFNSDQNSVPRPEYPRPQFVREDWLCLNGEWEFERDPGDSGHARDLLARPLKERILVPFCIEAELSGIGDTDFHSCVWYRREVEIPASWQGRDVILHFGAVDYDATVWVNGVEVGRHRGGFTSFSCPLRGVAGAGKRATIVVRARDVTSYHGFETIAQPRGKQAYSYAANSCFYTRTTGIWQTVWMEPVSRVHLKRPRITPDVGGSSFWIEQPLAGNRRGWRVRARLLDKIGGEVVCEVERRADLDLSPRLELKISGEARLWSISDPHLYGIDIELVDETGAIVDSIRSYAGLRSVALDGQRVLINGESVFQRLVLDQGYYPGGVMTAPSDQALIDDIELSKAVGFNGARLHQKIFEERFMYHADRLGYLVWSEFPDWGCNNMGPAHDNQKPGIAYAAQWLEAIERDYSHPSIVGWCPLNETWQIFHDRITDLDDATRAMFLAAKALDTTRPVIDASGYSHRVMETDIYDSHDYIYESDFIDGLAQFQKRQSESELKQGRVFTNPLEYDPFTGLPVAKLKPWSLPWRGQPYFVSEFGGFKWNPDTVAKNTIANETNRKDSWGYGSDPVDMEDFYRRFQGVCDVLLDNPLMFGYCYTQLTDVFPEENGLYFFDRSAKFDNARLHAIQTRPAAIEQTEPDSEAVENAAIRNYVRQMKHGSTVDIAEQEENEATEPIPQAV
ncbi:MAG TPA: glycoside hydrolase family 2 TIM barrel-domain containing protein [Abditibacteriaceae bacterium]|jgi:hypothetical protein